MNAIRPTPRDTSFVTPDVAQTSFVDYASSLVYDSLYHSPLSGIYRWSKSHLAIGEFGQLTYENQQQGEGELLTPEQATKTYGLDGELKFSEPVKESFAELLHDRKLAELRREYELYSGSRNSWGRKVSGFGISMVSTLVDPVNLAAMFVPVVGEINFFKGAEQSLTYLNRGLISPKTLARMVGTNRTNFRLAKGAIEGAVGAAMVEPFNVLPALDEQAHYSWKDSALNIAFSSGLGAGIRGIGGMFHDKFLSIAKGMKGLDPQTHEAATMGAIADIVQDKPVTSPGDIVSVDHNVVTSDLAEVNIENMFKIAEEHVDRLEQLPNPTEAQKVRIKLLRAMLNSPTDATPENLAAMFELKINEEAHKLPGAYDFIQSQNRNSKPLENRSFESFYDKYITKSSVDFEHQTHLNALEAKPEFKEAIKALYNAGYDFIHNIENSTYGQDTLVFLTKDKVIKISHEGFGKQILGISTRVEFEYHNADFTVWVEPRIHDLSNMDASLRNDLINAISIVAKQHGLEATDLENGANIGVDSEGNYQLYDKGTLLDFGDKPNKLHPEMMLQQLPKNSRERTRLLLTQLQKQIENAKQQAKEKIEARIKEIAERRSSEPKAEESLPKHSEPVKQTPDPINPSIEETEADLQAQLQEAIGGLEDDHKQVVELNPEIKKVQQLSEKIAKWADKTIKESKKKLNVGLDPELLVAYAAKGFIHFHSGLRDFAQWSKAMISEFGNGIKTHLKDIFEQIQSIKMTPEMIGLEQRSGVLGKQGYHYSIDPRLEASVQITDEGIHLTNLRVREEGKGTGSEFMNKLKTYADSNQLPITLTASPDEGVLQGRLNSFYEKHGFKSMDSEKGIGSGEYKYEPKENLQVVGEIPISFEANDGTTKYVLSKNTTEGSKVTSQDREAFEHGASVGSEGKWRISIFGEGEAEGHVSFDEYIDAENYMKYVSDKYFNNEVVWRNTQTLSPDFEFHLKNELTKVLADQKIKESAKISKAVQAGAACMNQKIF